ncbi:FecCD family ABC transporter permease [Geomicrobium sediminis]|uniref:Iron complex transport system permease protein n=1 Tax=Geomicrobium sediminis TaxID=1347788 RepID=A0ABS2PBT5_9BACL|nr:iron ABC transporter permease [Geomicrobium sediminis]MBM7632742.1 iron complex transport system permease protein [Geomicrobium sediminis]
MKEASITRKPISFIITLLIGIVSLVIVSIISVTFGAASITPSIIWDAIVSFDGSLTEHQIIQEIRIPRVVAAILIGGALAVSGAIMQGMTRNALAEPSIIGISDGAALALAIMFAYFTAASYTGLLVAAFIGAGVGTVLVFLVGTLSKGGLSPAKLALAGVTIGAFLSALSSGIAIYNDVAQDLSFWFAGGLSSVTRQSLMMVAIPCLIGVLIALLLSKSITIMSLGQDVARGLGQRTAIVRTLGVIAVMLMTGASVAVAGIIGFVGLVIPHMVRAVVGMDYRYVIPCSAVFGALLLVASDIVARMINAPYETPVGAITALIGVPFFLYLARREGRGV